MNENQTMQTILEKMGKQIKDAEEVIEKKQTEIKEAKDVISRLTMFAMEEPQEDESGDTKPELKTNPGFKSGNGVKGSLADVGPLDKVGVRDDGQQQH